MNSASNVMNESPAQATAIAPGAVSWSRQMYWCVRRELWESKSIYIAPIAAAAITLIACSISAMRLPERMRAAAALDPMQQIAIIERPFDLTALLPTEKIARAANLEVERGDAEAAAEVAELADRRQAATRNR